MENNILQTPKFSVVERQVGQQTRFMVQHPGAVVIVPWVDSQRICLIQNHRFSIDQTLIELPAGTREPSESAIETATRELAEETGYRCGKIEALFEFFVSPGIMDERMFAFEATDLVAGPTNLMDDETIDPLIVDFQESIEWIRTGKICDAKTIATLLYLREFRDGS